MIDTDKYEGYTENKWEWYESGDGDWILCPLFDGVKADEDNMWWVDENEEHIEATHDIFNWDERILDLTSDCMTGNSITTPLESFTYCSHSKERLPRKQADMNLIADAPLLFEEVKRLREENNRYLEFIFWLGIEHKGKKLAQEYGDEKIVEMIE